MGKKISVYLTDEALENLSEIRGYLERLTGCTLSRSSALNSLLIKGAGLFMDREAEVKDAVMRMLPTGKRSKAAIEAIVERLSAEVLNGPLMLEALRIAREEGHNERGD